MQKGSCMPTSKRNPIVSTIVVVLTIALCIQAAYYALSPYGQKSQLVWDEFRQQEYVDTICLGSSLSAHAYDPSIVDAICNTTSFNMSTPSQRVADSYLGLRDIVKKHKIKRVVYGIDLSNFINKSNVNPVRAFEYEKWKDDDLLTRCYDIAYMLQSSSCLFDERSINWLFPWSESHPTDGAQGILRNVQMRLDGTSIVEAAETNEKGWHYYGQGYGNFTTVLDYNKTVYKDFAEIEGFGTYPMNEREFQSLVDIAEFCEENNIELIVFVPALPDFSLISLKGYYTTFSEDFKKIVEAHGGSYYDFNVADPSFYRAQENHYEDYQHYNVDGGRAFSKALAKLIVAHSNGENVDTWFTSFNERLASIDHISAVRLFTRKIENATDRCQIVAECFAGPNVKVEYRFLAKAADESKYKVVKDWTPEPEFDFEPKSEGRFDIRVETRQQNSDSECERWAERAIVI